ncbi:accessory gene regulator B family protein [Paenibacillus sp. KR2-11]|uniref:accessory gene regulator B family protein n=1 Tax=Paenibacillus sp. KR2-11 TaxID=3385500 RepID=UPI0038FCEEC2
MAKSWDPSIEEHVEDIRFGVALRLNYYLVIFLTLLVGVLTHAFWNTVLTVISFVLLRRFTGGFHMPTLTWCLFVSVTLLSSIPHIPIVQGATYYLNLMSLLLVLAFSDKRTPDKLCGAVIMIITNLIFNSPIIAMTFLVQSVLLIKLRR